MQFTSHVDNEFIKVGSLVPRNQKSRWLYLYKLKDLIKIWKSSIHEIKGFNESFYE